MTAKLSKTSLMRSFRKKVCDEIDIEPEGNEWYIVYVPFMFDDGDHFVVILRRARDGNWCFTDEGHTLMHLGYDDVNLSSGHRAQVFEDALSVHGIKEDDGQLILSIPQQSYGDSPYSFLQGLSEVQNVGRYKQGKSDHQFNNQFRELVSSIVPAEKAVFDWHDADIDSGNHYHVDCLVKNNGRPWFVFGIGGTTKCQSATITCMRYESQKFDFESVAIFRDHEKVGRRPLAQLRAR